ncbi:MAG: TIGR03854 family LLM class F420-dependent oxidoreductase [Acidimicrobiales bacterium]
MKVRIGVGTGGSIGVAELCEVVDSIVSAGLDSIWLSEVLTGPVVDPLVGLAWACAHNPKIKAGTTMLLPGRNPLRLAKELASLDALSQGRLLVTLVPGLTHAPERDAIGVPPKQRGALIDEALPLLRRLWAGEKVSHHGETANFDDVTLSPLPHQDPLEVWLGGMAPAALQRCGRLADGWLPSLCTPAEAAEGKTVIDEAADRAGRSIDPEHFGVSVGYSREPLSDRAIAALAARSRGNDPTELVPVGMPALRALLERYLEVGFSKFVVRPLAPPASWSVEIEDLGSAVGDLQT